MKQGWTLVVPVMVLRISLHLSKLVVRLSIRASQLDQGPVLRNILMFVHGPSSIPKAQNVMRGGVHAATIAYAQHTIKQQAAMMIQETTRKCISDPPP